MGVQGLKDLQPSNLETSPKFKKESEQPLTGTSSIPEKPVVVARASPAKFSKHSGLLPLLKFSNSACRLIPLRGIGSGEGQRVSVVSTHICVFVCVFLSGVSVCKCVCA